MSRPALSWSTNVNPPADPTPGIAGGEKLNARASGSLANSRFNRCEISRYCSSRVERSSHGLNRTEKNPPNVFRTPLSML